MSVVCARTRGQSSVLCTKGPKGRALATMEDIVTLQRFLATWLNYGRLLGGVSLVARCGGTL